MMYDMVDIPTAWRRQEASGILPGDSQWDSSATHHDRLRYHQSQD